MRNDTGVLTSSAKPRPAQTSIGTLLSVFTDSESMDGGAMMFLSA